MATSNGQSSPSNRRSGSAFGTFILGILFTLIVLVGGIYLYIRYGAPPVATADAPFPLEAKIVRIPLDARIARQLQTPPIGTSEEAFESGAHIYATSCAFCHGTPGHDSPIANTMFPHAPQLWKKHAHGNVVGVSDDEPGETYWKVKNGIRLSGMPSYDHIYSETQMWQVSLLLKNADQPLPDPVVKVLQTPALP